MPTSPMDVAELPRKSLQRKKNCSPWLFAAVFVGVSENKVVTLRQLSTIHVMHYKLCTISYALFMLLLAACSGGQRQHIEAELLRARKMNKEYVNFTTDSVMLEVASWYDRHGTPNERMEAHYLLGCTYRDMGEGPRAIDCYHDAIACADTTAADCDFWMMASVYGQMATIYHQQLLLSYEKDAYRQAYRFNLLAGDTLSALDNQKIVAGIFILQNKKDSAETLLNSVIRQYQSYGHQQEALQASLMLMNIYTGLPQRQPLLKKIIEQYDRSSRLFDHNRNLPSSSRIFFYYKGAYYENAGLLDSAEYYYRKSYIPESAATAHEPAFKGLLSVFSKLQQPDSISKYAQLYCAANDSSITLKDQELTSLMAASYNYQHYQAEAMLNADKSRRHLLGAIISLTAALVLLIFNIKHKAAKKEKQKQLEVMRLKFDEVKKLYQQKRREMEFQEETHKKLVNRLTEEKARKQEEVSNLEMECADAQRTIDIINEQYKEFKKRHEAEIQSYKSRMEELTQQAKITGERENYRHFLERAIVRRIKLYAEKGNKTLSENETASLEEAVSEYYPDLICDLRKTTTIKNLDMQVCLLVLLDLGNKEIMQLLNISDKQVSNLKKDVNTALFNSNTARKLYKNLIVHYTFIAD